jgi:hypothetical protein
MAKRAFAIIALAVLGGCSDAPTTERALRQAGYRNIEITGWSPFGCGRDDTFSTGFKATAPSGERISGVVCSAYFKGATIRIY